MEENFQLDSRFIMLEHVVEEPAVMLRMLEGKDAVTEGFRELFLKNNIRRVYFTGSGSPANACEVLRYFCEKLLGVEATCLTPAVFYHHLDFNTRDYRPEEILLVCPAESGMAKGTVRVAARAKELGIHTACCTYNTTGLLAELCGLTIDKLSGKEIALPSTKGHFTGILIFLLCFVDTAWALGKITGAEREGYLADFLRAVKNLGTGLERSLDWFTAHKKQIMNCGSFWFLGYGANVSTAKEAALKFLECTKRPAFGYELEEFMHGPWAAVRPTDAVFFLCAEAGPERERMYQLIQFCRKISRRCVPLGATGDLKGMSLTTELTGREITSVLELLPPVQTLAFCVGDSLGYDMTRHAEPSIEDAMRLSFPDGAGPEVLHGQ